jgi:hypothetical protein
MVPGISIESIDRDVYTPRMLKACLVVLALGAFACGGSPKGAPTNTTKAETKPVGGARIEVVAQQTGGPVVEGTIRDAVTKQPLAGVTIVLTSPALQGEQTTITDEQGRFAMSALPPGKYLKTTYYSDQTKETSFELASGKLVKISLDLDQQANGEVVAIVPEPPPTFDTAIAALTKGAMRQAVELGEQELAKQASSKVHGTLAIARYGAAVEHLLMGALRGGGDESSRVKHIQQELIRFLGELDKVQSNLEAAAKDPQFVLELCVACITAEDSFFSGLPRRSLDIERDRTGKPLEENDPRRRPTFRFDHGDLAWGRAMISFQQAFLNIVLAYDWEWIEKMAADDAPTDPTLTIRLVEPARIGKARELLLAGLKFSDEARVAYTKETDDDREWVPSPKQQNYASPLTVDAKLYKTWEDIVGDIRSLVSGETGVSFVALANLFKLKGGAPAGFIDFGAMLKSPKDIVYELGALEKIENEQNANTRKQLATKVLKGMLGNGFKTTMKPSRITDRLLQLRKDLDQQGGEAIVEDKLKYFLWLN